MAWRQRDVFIVVAGALVISLAGLGLATVESRPGHQATLVPHGVQVKSAGDYTATAPSGTVVGGVCIPEPPATACTAARTEISWRLQGLPLLEYDAFLEGAQRVPLGPLAQDGDHHVLEYQDDVVHDASHVVLVIGDTDLLEVPVHAMDGNFEAVLDGAGSVRLDQIGAVSVSLLAWAELDAPHIDGLVYRAWLEEDTDWQFIDTLTFRDGTAFLDTRIERVDVPPAGRILITLEAGARGTAPAGFPAFEANLDAATRDA